MVYSSMGDVDEVRNKFNAYLTGANQLNADTLTNLIGKSGILGQNAVLTSIDKFVLGDIIKTGGNGLIGTLNPTSRWQRKVNQLSQLKLKLDRSLLEHEGKSTMGKMKQAYVYTLVGTGLNTDVYMEEGGIYKLLLTKQYINVATAAVLKNKSGSVAYAECIKSAFIEAMKITVVAGVDDGTWTAVKAQLKITAGLAPPANGEKKKLYELIRVWDTLFVVLPNFIEEKTLFFDAMAELAKEYAEKVLPSATHIPKKTIKKFSDLKQNLVDQNDNLTKYLASLSKLPGIGGGDDIEWPAYRPLFSKAIGVSEMAIEKFEIAVDTVIDTVETAIESKLVTLLKKPTKAAKVALNDIIKYANWQIARGEKGRTTGAMITAARTARTAARGKLGAIPNLEKLPDISNLDKSLKKKVQYYNKCVAAVDKVAADAGVATMKTTATEEYEGALLGRRQETTVKDNKDNERWSPARWYEG